MADRELINGGPRRRYSHATSQRLGPTEVRYLIGPPRASQVERHVEAVNALSADAIVLVGDLVDDQVADIGPIVEPVSGLSAPDGQYFVLGEEARGFRCGIVRDVVVFGGRRGVYALVTAAGSRVSALARAPRILLLWSFGTFSHSSCPRASIAPRDRAALRGRRRGCIRGQDASSVSLAGAPAVVL